MHLLQSGASAWRAVHQVLNEHLKLPGLAGERAHLMGEHMHRLAHPALPTGVVLQQEQPRERRGHRRQGREAERHLHPAAAPEC